MLPECNNGADNNPARNGWAKSNINLWEVKFATVKTNKSVFQAKVEKIKVFSPFLMHDNFSTTSSDQMNQNFG